MARREVIEVVCDRCKKTRIVGKDQITDETELSLAAYDWERKKIMTVTYKDLCLSCRKSVTNYVAGIVKWIDGEEKKTNDVGDIRILKKQ